FGSPVAGDEKFRWSGGDLQEGGIAPPVVELLTGRNGEAHADRHRPGGDLGRRPLGRQGAFVDLLRVLGQLHPGQRVGSGFDDEEFGIGRPARGTGVSSSVVGLDRRMAPSWVSGFAIEPSGGLRKPSRCWRRASSAGPSRKPKSKRPTATSVETSPVAGSRRRTAEVSESAK